MTEQSPEESPEESQAEKRNNVYRWLMSQAIILSNKQKRQLSRILKGIKDPHNKTQNPKIKPTTNSQLQPETEPKNFYDFLPRKK